MDEYISRKAAIEDLSAEALERNLDSVMTDDAHRYHRAAQRVIAGVPSADVRPVVRGRWKHVRWVKDDDEQEDGYWISRCSNCSMPYHTETPFCPHCGADMREKT